MEESCCRASPAQPMRKVTGHNRNLSCLQHNLTCVNWLWNHVRNLCPENGKLVQTRAIRQLGGPLLCTDIFDADETILITAKIPQEQTQR